MRRSAPPEALQRWNDEYKRISDQWEIQNYTNFGTPEQERSFAVSNQLALLFYLDQQVVNLPMYEFLSGVMQPGDGG